MRWPVPLLLLSSPFFYRHPSVIVRTHHMHTDYTYQRKTRWMMIYGIISHMMMEFGVVDYFVMARTKHKTK